MVGHSRKKKGNPLLQENSSVKAAHWPAVPQISRMAIPDQASRISDWALNHNFKPMRATHFHRPQLLWVVRRDEVLYSRPLSIWNVFRVKIFTSFVLASPKSHLVPTGAGTGADPTSLARTYYLAWIFSLMG